MASSKIVFLLLSALGLFSSCDCRKARIIGGTEADKSYPFMVSLQFKGKHFCGGSIINERTIVTAAHCVEIAFISPARLKVHVGDNSLEVENGKVYDVVDIDYHPLWNIVNNDYDVGLVRVNESFIFGTTVQPIILADVNDIVEPGTIATVLGWGVTNYNDLKPAQQLRVAELPIIDQVICNILLLGRVTDRMICAGFRRGGLDACQMDSGGPLFINNKVIGIVSWGIGCGQPYTPGVYARVSTLSSWVSTILSTKYNEVL